MSSPCPSGAAGAIAVRPARAADIPTLLALESASFESDRLSVRAMQHHLRVAKNPFLVAEFAGLAVGYALVLVRARSRTARLYSLARDRRFAGRGIGPALLAAAERAARERGASMMVLEVRPDNIAARRLYERAGYREAGRIPGFYEDGADAARLRRSLGAAPA